MDFCKIGSICEVKHHCHAFLDLEDSPNGEGIPLPVGAMFMVLEIRKNPNSCKILWMDMVVWLR